jgi:hypothetical protein
MKSSIFLILCMLCAGCAKYQYVTLSSALQDKKQQELVVENDTLKITYDFSGEDGPAQMTIQNKLTTPLYIDWTKSALIIGGTRASYSDKNLTLAAAVSGSEIRWLNYSSQSATIDGTLTSNEISGFIPPAAKAQETLLKLKPKFFALPTVADKKDRKYVDGIIVEFLSFSDKESPLVFRSYLTLSTNADLSSPMHFDHEFWVSEVFQTTTGPKKFSTKPNRFYLKKTSNAGAYVLGAAALGGVVWALQYKNEKASLD